MNIARASSVAERRRTTALPAVRQPYACRSNLHEPGLRNCERRISRPSIADSSTCQLKYSLAEMCGPAYCLVKGTVSQFEGDQGPACALNSTEIRKSLLLAPPAGFEPAHTAPETGCRRTMELGLSCENLSWVVFLAGLLSRLSRGRVPGSRRQNT